jgi:hypothetical protein
MNDTELDEVLNQWTVPPVPPSLRENLRGGFAASLPPTAPPGVLVRWRSAFAPSARKTLLAAAIVAVGALLFAVTQALSQTPPPVRIPYTVDSEFIRYGDDGSRAVELYSTSYPNQNGGETVLSRSIPGHPFGTAVGRTLDVALPYWQRYILPFAVSSKDMEAFRKMRLSELQTTIGVITGCADATCLVIQHYSFRRAPVGSGNA